MYNATTNVARPSVNRQTSATNPNGAPINRLARGRPGVAGFCCFVLAVWGGDAFLLRNLSVKLSPGISPYLRQSADCLQPRHHGIPHALGNRALVAIAGPANQLLILIDVYLEPTADIAGGPSHDLDRVRDLLFVVEFEQDAVMHQHARDQTSVA